MPRVFLLTTFIFTLLINGGAMCQNAHNQIVKDICMNILMRNSYDSIQLNVNGLGVSPIDQSIVVFTPDSLRKSILDFRLLEKNIQTAILLNKHFPIFPLSDTLHIVDSLGSFEKMRKKI